MSTKKGVIKTTVKGVSFHKQNNKGCFWTAYIVDYDQSACGSVGAVIFAKGQVLFSGNTTENDGIVYRLQEPFTQKQFDEGIKILIAVDKEAFKPEDDLQLGHDGLEKAIESWQENGASKESVITALEMFMARLVVNMKGEEGLKLLIGHFHFFLEHFNCLTWLHDHSPLREHQQLYEMSPPGS